MNNAVIKQVSYSVSMIKVSKKGLSSLYLANVLHDCLLNITNNSFLARTLERSTCGIDVHTCTEEHISME